MINKRTAIAIQPYYQKTVVFREYNSKRQNTAEEFLQFFPKVHR